MSSDGWSDVGDWGEGGGGVESSAAAEQRRSMAASAAATPPKEVLLETSKLTRQLRRLEAELGPLREKKQEAERKLEELRLEVRILESGDFKRP